MKIHVVQKGETLFSIAQQYGVSARLLQKLNQVPPDGTLVPGQTLVVLLPETELACLYRAPHASPAAYAVGGAVFALRREDAAQIIVEAVR